MALRSELPRARRAFVGEPGVLLRSKIKYTYSK
jgi:hypothetical protein